MSTRPPADRLLTRVAGACLVGGAALISSAAPATAAGSSVPFTDPNAHGYIAFCDLAGNNVTSGSVTSAPFVWAAISSMPTPSGYGGKGQNTALTIYQPRRGVDPIDWTGDQLTAASFYRKGSLPAADATYKDISLATIVKEFPPTWNGLYELRMIFARKGYGDYTSTYPATVIQVTGKTWHVVQGGTLPCNRAHTVSDETFAGISVVNPHASKTQTPTSAPEGQRAGSTGSGSASSSSSSGESAHVITAALSGDAASGGSSSSDAPALVIAGIALIVLGVLGGGLIWRRRGNGVRAS